MKRLVMPALALAALCFAAAGLANNGHPGGKGKKPPARQMTFGPYTLTSDDNGSCSGQPGFESGQKWAVDTTQRTWRVKQNEDGTFRVERRDRGAFVTTGPVSPGKCDNRGKHHGSVVLAGIAGKFHGYLKGTVSAGTYNPNACTAANCATMTDFLTTVFGNPSRFTCFNGYAGCKFDFEYRSGDQRLKYRHWEDRGTDGVHEYFSGDIATA
jgi:hypothetical protein